jgi:Tol biopolymer transport system component
MKFKKVFIFAAFAASIMIAFGFQSSSEHKVLFEKAKFTMETKGDIKGAIKLFEEIIRKYPDEREYAAKSQLYIGLCYEKLGLEQAQKAFQKVIDNYPEQSEAVKIAKEKLAIILRAQTIIEKKDKDFTIKKAWAGPDVDILGAPSPDGKYLSYVDWSTGDVALRDLVTEKKRRLSSKGSWYESNDFALYSIWSPDGKNVACNWYNEKDNIFDLRIYGLADSTHHILYNKTEYTHPLDWSSDGKYILTYFAEDNKNTHLGLLSVQDGSMYDLKSLGKFYPFKASLSPDGGYFAYDLPLEKDSFHRDIFILSTDGKREIALVVHPADDALIGWTPDGKSILFVSDRTGTLDVWAIQASLGKPQAEPELIRKDIGRIWPLGFTQNGSLYYGLETSMQDAYIAALDMEMRKVLSSPTRASKRFIGANTSPDWSPDGRYLAYVSKRLQGPERPGSRVLCIKNLESGEEKEFIPELRNFGRFLYWAPDGLSIIVTGIDMEYRNGLYKIDAQTGNTALWYINEKNAMVDFVFSPDGKEIFFRRWDEKRNISYISQYNLLTKQEKEIYSAPSIINLILSPDGNHLAFCEDDKKTKSQALKISSVKGGESRELVRVKQPEWITFQSCTWTPDGRHILYGTGMSMPQNPQVELWRVSVDGGEPQKLGLSMDWMRHVRVHPDGKRITFCAGQSTNEIWFMENFLPELKNKR